MNPALHVMEMDWRVDAVFALVVGLPDNFQLPFNQ